MAAFQTSEIAPFQTIHVTSDGQRAIAFPVDDQGRKEDIEFSHEATILLIEGIKKRYQELTSNNRARPQVYRDLHEELTQHGYNFSVERIRRKWNNLLGTYKRVKKEFLPHKPPWEYYQVLSEFIERDHSFSNSSGGVTFTQTGGGALSGVSVGGPAAGVTVHVPSPQIAKQMEQGNSRQVLLQQYLKHIGSTQNFQYDYKRRKEKRERLKLRALRKIARELHVIARTQCEILKKQDTLLKALAP
ncbi:hypothetical protein Pcinc_015533 [Petrolisthes cinctipes]|uniref:Myb/SANT-like DNA-binding domain-containing protein n=1 Tax=Petrolisthes cinctipes TaxID=88211 RepID=A0AAE1KPM6_PETCI|nr:hypothetical protein Pcinc_015533 [Petrolisthes cinctipes]